jgi:hypothetical protein
VRSVAFRQVDDNVVPEKLQHAAEFKQGRRKTMAKEGLAYCVTRRTEGPFTIPASASEKDILKDFLKFCLNGVRDQDGKPVNAPNTGGKMTGTVNWLASLGRFEANFYVAHKPALMFFVSLAEGTADWRKMPGFMLFVRKVDLTLPLHIDDGQFRSDGEFILEQKTDLDKALADMKPRIERVSERNRPRLIDALRGDRDTDLKQVIAEVDRAEGIGLSEFFDERLQAFEAQLALESSSDQKQD